MTTTHPFRFALMTAPYRDGETWLGTARRAEELGYGTLMSPDGPQLRDPLLALALAAGATGLRVGTFVLAGPLRPPRLAAWQAHSLTALTGGRFDFGIGAGLPAFEQPVRDMGLPFGSPAQRLAAVGEAVDRLRELDGTTQHTPVLIAAGGPRSRALAAAKADIVTLGAPPLTSRDEFAAQVADLRARAGERAESIQLAANLFAIGDEIPPDIAGFVGATLDELTAVDSLVMLRGSVTQMCDELQRRRERFGLSYYLVNAGLAEAFAPLLERLDGQ
jgi:alkanesulfonate monooxygenase SsuD/methylene tetrahydromethanopterin reductase-like flavin-dependent oxidoreductase (luciferase family)